MLHGCNGLGRGFRTEPGARSPVKSGYMKGLGLDFTVKWLHRPQPSV